MPSIVVIGNSPGWHFQDLQRAGHGRAETRFVSWNEISTTLGASADNQIGESIHLHGDDSSKVDAVLVRGMPVGSLEQVVFRMDLLARWQATGVPVFNSPKALEAAIDKYLSLALIHEAGLPVPRTHVCQSVETASAAFHDLGGDVVLKPVFGGEGRGILRLDSEELAIRAFRTIANLQGTLYLQEFMDHQNRDTRCLVIGDQVIGMTRESAEDFRTNANRGAQCHAVSLSQEQIRLARGAAAAVGATIAGVDLIQSKDNQSYVLEVNGIPGWQHISKATGRDIAEMVLHHVLANVQSI